MTFSLKEEVYPGGKDLRGLALIRVKGEGSFVELHLERKARRQRFKEVSVTLK